MMRVIVRRQPLLFHSLESCKCSSHTVREVNKPSKEKLLTWVGMLKKLSSLSAEKVIHPVDIFTLRSARLNVSFFTR